MKVYIISSDLKERNYLIYQHAVLGKRSNSLDTLKMHL